MVCILFVCAVCPPPQCTPPQVCKQSKHEVRLRGQTTIPSTSPQPPSLPPRTLTPLPPSLSTISTTTLPPPTLPPTPPPPSTVSLPAATPTRLPPSPPFFHHHYHRHHGRHTSIAATTTTTTIALCLPPPTSAPPITAQPRPDLPTLPLVLPINGTNSPPLPPCTLCAA